MCAYLRVYVSACARVQLSPAPAVTLTLSAISLPRRGTSPGCLRALFRLGTYPGSFNPRPDGTSCWHCWPREGLPTIVLSMSTPLEKFRGGDGSLAGSTGLPLSHLDIRQARGVSPTCQPATPNKGFSKKEARRPLRTTGDVGTGRSCLVRVHLRNTKGDRNKPPRKEPEEGFC